MAGSCSGFCKGTTARIEHYSSSDNQQPTKTEFTMNALSTIKLSLVSFSLVVGGCSVSTAPMAPAAPVVVASAPAPVVAGNSIDVDVSSNTYPGIHPMTAHVEEIHTQMPESDKGRFALKLDATPTAPAFDNVSDAKEYAVANQLKVSHAHETFVHRSDETARVFDKIREQNVKSRPRAKTITLATY